MYIQTNEWMNRNRGGVFIASVLALSCHDLLSPLNHRSVVTFRLPTAWRKQKWMKCLGTCCLVSGRSWWFCLKTGLSSLKWTEMPRKLEMYTGHKISVYTYNDSTSFQWPLSPGCPSHKGGVVSVSAPLLLEHLLILSGPTGSNPLQSASPGLDRFISQVMIEQ